MDPRRSLHEGIFLRAVNVIKGALRMDDRLASSFFESCFSGLHDVDILLPVTVALDLVGRMLIGSGLVQAVVLEMLVRYRL